VRRRLNELELGGNLAPVFHVPSTESTKGYRIARHARQIIFQLAEVAVSREVFALILDGIG
jgi:hypothetical protein